MKRLNNKTSWTLVGFAFAFLISGMFLEMNPKLPKVYHQIGFATVIISGLIGIILILLAPNDGESKQEEVLSDEPEKKYEN